MTTSLSFLIFCAVATYLFLPGLLNTKRIFEYPWLIGFLCFIWVIPAGIYVEKSGFAATYDAHIYWFYGAGCILAIKVGFDFIIKRPLSYGPSKPAPRFNHQTLTIIALGMVVVGGVCLNQSLSMAQSQGLGQQWTGAATFLYLLSQLSYYGIALAALLFIRRQNMASLIIVLLGVLIISPAIFIMVKRHVIFEVFVLLGGAVFFMTRLVPPRSVMVGLAVMGTLLLHQVGNVRAYVATGQGSTVDAVMDGELFKEFSYFNLQNAPELEEGIFDVAISRQENSYNYGADYWNRFVHQYVPAFIVGADTKENLKVDSDIKRTRQSIIDLDYPGATRTGITDSFVNFWYLGIVIFLGLGLLLGWAYRLAMAGHIKGQFVYLLLLNDGLFAITDSTARFAVGLPFLFIVMFFVFKLAEIQKQPYPAPDGIRL